ARVDRAALFDSSPLARRSGFDAAPAPNTPTTQPPHTHPPRATTQARTAPPTTPTRCAQEDSPERPIRPNDTRMDIVVETLREAGAKKIADLGCGEGKLLARLLRERGPREIT